MKMLHIEESEQAFAFSLGNQLQQNGVSKVDTMCVFVRRRCQQPPRSRFPPPHFLTAVTSRDDVDDALAHSLFSSSSLLKRLSRDAEVRFAPGKHRLAFLLHRSYFQTSVAAASAGEGRRKERASEPGYFSVVIPIPGLFLPSLKPVKNTGRTDGRHLLA